MLDIEQSTKGINNVHIILGRSFFATSNALINCGNGLMHLTFGNMTMEVNVFNLFKKANLFDEEDPKEAFVIDSVVEEHMDGLMSDDVDVGFLWWQPKVGEITKKPSRKTLSMIP